MNKKILLFFPFFFIISIFAKIIESDTMEIINSYLTEDTLVIFDIDNTLATPKQEMGSDQWFHYLVNEKIKEGYDYLLAFYTTLPLFHYVNFNISLHLTEAIIPSLIQTLTEKNISTMALTARCLFLAEITNKQLSQLDIKLNFQKSTKQEFILSMPLPCLFKYNILFAGLNDKGKTLLCFLDTIDYYPKQIIFIDDKVKNVQSVEAALTQQQIPCICIRYSRCDEKVHNFDPAKAQAQYDALQLQNTRTLKQI